MDARFMAIFIAFICVFAANNSEGGRNLGENIPDNVQVVDEDTTEQAWNYCKKELKDGTERVKGLDTALSRSITVHNGDEFFSTLLTKRRIQKAIDDLPPKERETILHCLRERNFPLQVLEDDHCALSNRCQNLFSGWTGVPRRYLRRYSSERRILSTGSSPAPSPVSKPPHSGLIPNSDPSYSDYYHSPSDTDYPSPSNVIYHSPDKEKISPIPSQDENNQKYLIAAVVATFFASLGLVALVILICTRRDKRLEPKTGRRDGKPLLNFGAASDIPAGLSEKPHVMGTPIMSPLPAAGATQLDANYVSSQDGFQPTAAHAETLGKTLLPLPPGRAASPSGLTAGVVGAAVGLGEAAVGAGAAAAVGPGVGAAAAGAVDVAAEAGAPPPPPPGAPQPPPPGAPPPPPPKPPAPTAPPPPPRGGRRPPPPNPPMPARPLPLGPHHRHTSTGDTSDCSDESGAPKTKLKPFFWDKVLASPDHSMVWHEIKAGSFQFNEEMMEALFGYTAADKKNNENRKSSASESSPQFIQIIEPKKSQNLSILLKALNVTTEEVCDALKEGNELPSEFIQNLLKMAPTADEELKLRLYSGEHSLLGPADRFLKAMVEIPYAFKRMESLLFMSTFQEELTSIKDNLATLEVACEELKSSKLFLKLLEAVLKTGNRMNDGTYRGGAQAFKLDTLLKLSDVKGTDGKTTLLHFVVHEIIRSEGVRAARKLRENRSMSSVKTEDLFEDHSHETEDYYRNLGLQVVSGLSNELRNVKKAALIDHEILSESVSKLGQGRFKTTEFLENEMKNLEGEHEFFDMLTSFINQCESDIKWLIDEEKRIMAMVKSTGDYFQGRAGRDEGARAHLFVIVRDFLVMVDKSCLDVKNSIKLPAKTARKDVSAPSSPSPSQDSPSETPREIHQRLFPAMRQRQIEDDDDDDFSSDSES